MTGAPLTTERPQTGRRIADRLHAAVGSSLIVVVGPARSGKSAGLHAFAREFSGDVRIVALDETCARTSHFAERLALSLLTNPADVLPAPSLGDLRATVSEELRKRGQSRSPFCLAIDNADVLAASPEALRLLEFAYEILPRGCHLVLVGRFVPSAMLERQAIASGTLITAERASDRGNSEVRDNRGSDDTQSVADGVPPVGELLALSVWPDLLRGHASPPREAGLAGGIDYIKAHPKLAEFHPQWRPNRSTTRSIRDAVCQLEDCDKDVRAIERACVMLANGGAIQHAIDLAVISRSPVVINRVIALVGRRLILGNETESLNRLLVGLGSATLTDSPPLTRSIAARLAALTSGWERAYHSAHETMQVLTADGTIADLEALSHCLITIGQVDIRTGNQTDPHAHAIELEKLIDRSTDCYTTADLCLHLGDYFLYRLSNYHRAEFFFRRAGNLAEIGEIKDVSIQTAGCAKLAQIAHSSGRLAQAIELAGQVVEALQEAHCTTRLPVALNNLSMSYAEAGEVAAAEEALGEALCSAELVGNPVHEAYALASLAELQLSLGRADEAWDNYTASLAICSRGLVEERLRALVLAGLSSCALRLGRRAEALVLSTRSITLAESSTGPVDQATCHVEHAHALAAAGDFAAGEQLMSEALAVLEAAGAIGPALQVRLRTAAFQFTAGNARGAKRSARQALSSPYARTHRGVVLGVLRGNPEFTAWARQESSLRRLLAPFSVEDCLPAAPVDLASTASIAQRRKVDVHPVATAAPSEAWASAQTRALFELFIAHQDGVSAAEARRLLSPQDPSHRGNSALHNALYQLELALSPGAILRDGDHYRLAPHAIEEGRRALAS